MTKTHIDGALLRRMLMMGASLLEQQRASIDALNVFPVPDGDTGTNMSLTLNSAVRELRQCESTEAGAVASALSAGALRGARGNSGVILSQLFRGFARAVKDAPILDIGLFAEALKTGSSAAYKAVTKPKEGTLLTVARVVAQTVASEAASGAQLSEVLEKMVKSAADAVAKTPGQLPVLKEAGVVDAGGKGLLIIYTGFLMAYRGETVPDDYVFDDAPAPLFEDNIAFDQLEEIEFAYCTEFLVQQLKQGVTEKDAESLRAELEKMGDSIVVVFDEEMIKIHIHTNEPGKALQMALELGELNGIKIENMLQQQRDMVEKRKASEKEFGIVVVSAGEGFERVFKDLMVDEIVTGGQTMNPSADELMRTIQKVHARTVFVFPNNKNIVLAARQARKLSSKSVVVIPSKSLPEGVAGVLAFHPDASLEENELRMNQALKHVKSGSVTTAVRDTRFNGFEIKTGDFIGLLSDDIVVCGKDLREVSSQLLDRMIGDDGELLTLFYGDGVTEQQANELTHGVSERHPECDCIVQKGSQPLYHYIFSVE